MYIIVNQKQNEKSFFNDSYKDFSLQCMMQDAIEDFRMCVSVYNWIPDIILFEYGSI